MLMSLGKENSKCFIFLSVGQLLWSSASFHSVTSHPRCKFCSISPLQEKEGRHKEFGSFGYCFYYSDKTLWPKSPEEEDGSFHLTSLRAHTITEGSLRQDLRGRKESTHCGVVLLTGLLPVAC